MTHKSPLLVLFAALTGVAYGQQPARVPDSASLKMDIRLSSARIRAAEPLVLVLQLTNTGKDAAEVLPLELSSGKPQSEPIISASLLVGKDKADQEVAPAMPYFSLKRFSELGIRRIAKYELLAPGTSICVSFPLGGRYLQGEKWAALFPEPGTWRLAVKYYPFLRPLDTGALVLDQARGVESNVLDVSVQPLTDDDQKCWDALRANEAGWLIYDGQWRNRGAWYETAKVVEFFSALRTAHPKSVFAPYLDFVANAKTYLDNKQPPAAREQAKAALGDLATRADFPYRDMVRTMLEPPKPVAPRVDGDGIPAPAALQEPGNAASPEEVKAVQAVLDELADGINSRDLERYPKVFSPDARSWCPGYSELRDQKENWSYKFEKIKTWGAHYVSETWKAEKVERLSGTGRYRVTVLVSMVVRPKPGTERTDTGKLRLIMETDNHGVLRISLVAPP